MKSFIFNSLWILSHGEQAGRVLHFHHQKNLIYGKNHTGKSSLIRTLFLTLGANPLGKLAKWDTGTVSLLDFQIDHQRYRLLRQRNARTLFNADGTLIGVTQNFSQWAKFFANIIGFNLVLAAPTLADHIIAGPESFFLPFYINQDSTWQNSLNTFRWPQWLPKASSHISIMEYFSGIKPLEYYSTKARYDDIKKDLRRLEREIKHLENAKKRIVEKLPPVGLRQILFI